MQPHRVVVLHVAPLLVRLVRWLEPRARVAGCVPPTAREPGLRESAIHVRWASRRHVLVQHHERQPPVALQGMALGEGGDGLVLGGLQPVVAGDHAMVLVGPAVACAPVAELARRQPDPSEDSIQGNLGRGRPVPGGVHPLAADVMGDPTGLQVSPSPFLRRMCFSIGSEMASCLHWTRRLRSWTRISASAVPWCSRFPPGSVRELHSESGVFSRGETRPRTAKEVSTTVRHFAPELRC